MGVPVRAPVRQAALTPYQAANDQAPFRLLVFGGSQGARFFSDVMPATLAALPTPLRRRIVLTQQVREEDLPRLRAAFKAVGVEAELATFFQNLPERIAASHLVIARAGASTIAELAVIGRPSILVPLPHAIDNDQLRNAEALASIGGASVAEQGTLTPEALATLIENAVNEPNRLSNMAQAAKSVGIVDAVERLADVVVSLAKSRDM